MLEEKIDERDLIAERLRVARPGCRTRQLGCACCHSMAFQGCIYLAEAVLTPIVDCEEALGDSLK